MLSLIADLGHYKQIVLVIRVYPGLDSRKATHIFEGKLRGMNGDALHDGNQFE